MFILNPIELTPCRHGVEVAWQVVSGRRSTSHRGSNRIDHVLAMLGRPLSAASLPQLLQTEQAADSDLTISRSPNGARRERKRERERERKREREREKKRAPSSRFFHSFGSTFFLQTHESSFRGALPQAKACRASQGAEFFARFFCTRTHLSGSTLGGSQDAG